MEKEALKVDPPFYNRHTHCQIIGGKIYYKGTHYDVEIRKGARNISADRTIFPNIPRRGDRVIIKFRPGMAPDPDDFRKNWLGKPDKDKT